MKGRVLGLAVAATLAGLPATAQETKIKVGFVNTFSGPNAAIGNEERNAFELVLDHLGRKLGGIPVEVIYEDDQMKPEVGKQVTEKLIQTDKVHFLTGYNWSNVLLASLKPAVDSETFIISGNAGPSQIAGELCSPFFFNASWQNDQTPMAMGEQMNKLGVKKLYLMGPNYAAGKDMIAGAKRTFKGEIVAEEYTRWPGQLDFSAELSKIRASNADGTFVFYPGAAGAQYVTQYSQAGLSAKTPLYSVFTLDAITLPLVKELGLGHRSTASWVQDLPFETNKKFVADYRKKHNTYPSYYGSQHYDVGLMMDAMVKAAKGDFKNKDAMRKAIREANFETTRGKIKWGPNHFPIQNFYLQEVVKDSEGNLTMKTIDTVYKDHADSYASLCKMK
jgi:branched-chain amino acid transport system substrate-binding protein